MPVRAGLQLMLMHGGMNVGSASNFPMPSRSSRTTAKCT